MLIATVRKNCVTLQLSFPCPCTALQVGVTTTSIKYYSISLSPNSISYTYINLHGSFNHSNYSSLPLIYFNLQLITLNFFPIK